MMGLIDCNQTDTGQASTIDVPPTKTSGSEANKTKQKPVPE